MSSSWSSSQTKSQYISPSKEQQNNINKFLKRSALIKGSTLVSCPEVVSKVLQNVLNLESHVLQYGNSDENASSRTNSFPEKYNEMVIKLMCGKINEDIKGLFTTSNFKHIIYYENFKINEMRVYSKEFLKLYNGLSNVMKELKNDVLKSPEEYMPFNHNYDNVKSATQRLPYPTRVNADPPIIVIGPFGTVVPESGFSKIRWSTPQGAARRLCALVFDFGTVMTTKFKSDLLDPCKVSDIEHCVHAKTNGSPDVIRKPIAHATHIKYFRHRSDRNVKF